MQLHQKQKVFSTFFFYFRDLNLILNIFKKKMTLIADAFLNLRTPEDVVR